MATVCYVRKQSGVSFATLYTYTLPPTYVFAFCHASSVSLGSKNLKLISQGSSGEMPLSPEQLKRMELKKQEALRKRKSRESDTSPSLPSMSTDVATQPSEIASVTTNDGSTAHEDGSSDVCDANTVFHISLPFAILFCLVVLRSKITEHLIKMKSPAVRITRVRREPLRRNRHLCLKA